MKILLVEDCMNSIENAKTQLAGHDIRFASTVFELEAFLFKINDWKPEAIVTDVNIPMGDAGYYGVKDHYAPTDLSPAGLVLAINCLLTGVPCFVITDANSHEDLIGLLLDKVGQNWNLMEPESTDLTKHCYASSTRPKKLENGGKDYSRVLGWLQTLENYSTA